METIIQKLQVATDICDLTEHIIAYDEYRKTFKRAALYQFGISPAKEWVRATATGKAHADLRETAILELAETYLDIKDVSSHKERKKKIESALNLLITLYKNSKEKLPPKAFILIARAYLLRSLIIRPKGMTVPEKKKECLKKGITFVEKALNASAILNSSDKEDACRVQCLLLIELNKIDERQCNETTLKGKLEEAITKGCDKFYKNEEDVRIAIRYSEIKPIDTNYPATIVKLSSKGTYFEKAKAFYLLSDWNNFKEYLYKAIRYLRWMKFSHPQWDEMVCFLIKMRDDKNPLWKKFSVKAWQACQIQERGTPPINLRWHWSRQRDLYDLAFLAVYLKDTHTQHDYELMARICDSQKSRTSLRWSSVDDMVKESPNEGTSTNDLRAFLKSEKEAYALAMMGGYVMDISERMKALHAHYRETFKKQQSQQRGITDVTNGWIVIHFYLNQLEEKCYALIYNADTATWQSKCVKEYKKLFQTFLTWQTNYNQHKEQAANHLVRLCKEIGDAMPFLIIPQGKDVLFIPHDFLHRLPLHGAIGKDKNGNKIVFLENHPCCYLPAWSFAKKTSDSKVNGRILLKNFPDYDYQNISDQKYWTSPVKNAASPADLKAIDTSPELLAILCHGKADAVNPFNARLKLTEGGITHIEILNSVKNIKGSRIILGACETDLVPPLSDVIDEHLSITTAFLTNNAREILGTMWEVYPDKVEEIIKKVRGENINFKPLYKIINTWQTDKLAAWQNNSDIFYDVISFRNFTSPEKIIPGDE